MKCALLIAAILAGELLYMRAAVPGYLGLAHGGDYPYYVQMADAPLTTVVPSPWRYRLLNPWLASLLVRAGMPMDLAFLSLTAVFAFASSLLMREFLRQLSLTGFAASAGAVLFAMSIGGYVPLRRYYGYMDAMLNCFILLILLAAGARRRAMTAALLGVGTLAKESTLLLLPFLVVRLRQTRERWTAIALIAAVPLLVFGALRLIVGFTSDSSFALTWDAQRTYWETAMVHGFARWILWSFAYSMGPIWLLAALAVPTQLRFCTIGLWLLLPLVAPLLRTTDTERALLLSFPVIFPLAMSCVDQCRSDAGRLTLAVVSSICALVAQLTFDWAPTTRVWVFTAKDLTFVALCLLPALATLCLRSPGVRACLEWPDSDARFSTAR